MFGLQQQLSLFNSCPLLNVIVQFSTPVIFQKLLISQFLGFSFVAFSLGEMAQTQKNASKLSYNGF
jgi:hypothetical protein